MPSSLPPRRCPFRASIRPSNPLLDVALTSSAHRNRENPSRNCGFGRKRTHRNHIFFRSPSFLSSILHLNLSKTQTSEARRLGHNFVGTEQILLGLIGESTGIAAKVLKSMGVNLKDARVEVEKIIGRGSGFVAVEIPFTPRAKRVLELSLEEARQLGHNYIGTEHILLGLLREGEGVAARVLETLGADPAKIRTQVIRMVGESQEAVGVGGGAGGAGGASSNKMPTLEEYGTNLTTQATEGKLDPVVGRKKEIERVTQILGRRTKNNPCLIGEPGVGKTAVAEGLAQKIATGDVPETIEGKQVVTLDMGLLVRKFFLSFLSFFVSSSDEKGKNSPRPSSSFSPHPHPRP